MRFVTELAIRWRVVSVSPVVHMPVNETFFGLFSRGFRRPVSIEAS